MSPCIDAPTSNHAAHMRYLLTSRAGLQEPYSLAKLDAATLVELYQYVKTNDYKFNFIADTEQNVWSRLVQVLAPARAAPTTDVDALWGVVIDNANKEPTQMFTPRNSWGWKVNKAMPRLPHALRVKLVDETQDYAQVEQFVYMDGYSVDGANGTEKATYIIEWDYSGVTTWPQLYALAREHMARLMHRAHSVTLNTDWEWMATRRGKLVRAYSDILMNAFPNGGAARVERLVYDVDGIEVAVGREADIPTDAQGVPLIPIGMQLDDTFVFNEPAPARYGVSVRDESSRLTVYEIVPEYGEEEHSTIYFKHVISAANIPPLRSLCTVALLEGENYADYLVVSMDHGDNNSAEIKLIPWAIGSIKAAASGPIPPYNPSIILDVTKGSSLPTPIIRDVRSDESVLIRAASGGSTQRIAAWWELGVATEAATNLNFQLMATDVETGASVFGSAPSFEDYVAAIGVEEKRLYDVRVRALDPATGKTSAWSTPIRHAVIGRTTPPPAPDAVNLDGYTGFPIDAPLYLDVVSDSEGTTATQIIWSAILPDILYMRAGIITYDETDETDPSDPTPPEGPGYTISWSPWKEMGGGGGSLLGEIRMLPFRTGDLPSGWYYCNGDQYALTSVVGVALNALPTNFKADWGITVSGANISLPSMFYTDGRGFFLRAVNGSTRQVGSVEQDAMQNITGYVGFNQGAIFSPGRGEGGAVYATTNNSVIPNSISQGGGAQLNIDASRVARTATENRSLNKGMTPAIFLGV